MCGCGSTGNSVISPQANYPLINAPVINTNCTMTNEILTTWKAILECIKSSSKEQQVNLSVFAVNQLLGVIQSALNYPDNYCYYEEQLNFFKINILPTIIQNVPECI